MSYYQAISQNTIPEVRSNLYALPSNAQISLTIDINGTQYTSQYDHSQLVSPWYEQDGGGGIEQSYVFNNNQIFDDFGGNFLSDCLVSWFFDEAGNYRVYVQIPAQFTIVQLVNADTDLNYLMDFGAVESVETIGLPEETGDLISHNPFNNLSVVSTPNKLTFCLTPTTNRTALLDLFSGTLIETTSTVQFISSATSFSYFSYYIKGPELNFNIQVPTANTFLFQNQYFRLENIAQFSIQARASEEDLVISLVDDNSNTEQFLTTFPGDILAVSFNNNILSITNANGTISLQSYIYNTSLNFFLTCITDSLNESYPLANINILFDTSIQIFPRTTTHYYIIDQSNL